VGALRNKFKNALFIVDQIFWMTLIVFMCLCLRYFLFW